MPVLAWLRCAAEGAVDDYLGKPIASVQLLIEGRETSEPSIVRVVETRVGEPLAMSSVRDSISHLFSLGRFDDIRVDATLVDAGRVALRYELSPIHPVTKIEFTGPLSVPGIDTGQLRRAVDRSLRHVAVVGPCRGAQAAGERPADRTRLSSRRHPAAGRDRARAGSGDAGVRDRSRARAPRSARSTSTARRRCRAPELLARLDLATGAPYRRDELNTRIERYIADRRKAGYYEAKLTVTPMLVNGDRTANLVLTVMPGTACPRGVQG